MLASDLGYLALGGLLGALAGAGILAVLRSRPPTPRRVRLTMTLGSVPIRPSATTLAIDPFAPDPRRVARRGPADMEWQDDEAALARSDPDPAANRTPIRSAAPHEAGIGPRMAADVTIERAPSDPVPDAGSEGPGGSIGLSVGSGADPVLAAINASGPSREAPAGAPGATTGPAARSTHRSSRDDGVGVPVLMSGPGSPVGIHETAEGSGIAVLEAAIRARRGMTGVDMEGTVATMTRPEPRAAATDAEPGSPALAGGAAIRPMARSRGGEGIAGGGGDQPAASAPSADPCAEARHTVEERCALAERMRLTADRAADALREAQRTFDVHVAHADAAAAIADPRAQRAAKDDAQNAFRTQRGRADSRESVEQAARDWLQEINRINGSAREASAALIREREAAAALQPTIERLTVEADAARVQAEGAAESCLQARETLAACEEALVAARSAPSGGRDTGKGGAGKPGGPARVPAGAPGGSLPAGDGAEEEGALAIAIHSGAHPAILRLLAGDRAVMQRLVVALAEDDPNDRRRWQIQLADLVDAIVSRAIEGCAFVFPDDHPFWAPFNLTQGRDIALALSSLGFRFDGMGGFADERSPSQRDVSLALGYAGLDPMRVRRWPSEAELGELYRDVTVAADEYILGAAPGLTLGELVGILGRRADGLTEVWNAWGRIRPILLEDMGAPSLGLESD